MLRETCISSKTCGPCSDIEEANHGHHVPVKDESARRVTHRDAFFGRDVLHIVGQRTRHSEEPLGVVVRQRGFIARKLDGRRGSGRDVNVE